MYPGMLKSAALAHIADDADETCGVVAKLGSKGSQEVYKFLSAFSNSEGGGFLIFGLDVDSLRHYYLRGVDDVPEMEKALREQCSHMDPEVKPLFFHVEIEGKTILGMEVPEIGLENKPCYYRGVGRSNSSYAWEDGALRRLEEVEIYTFDAYREGFSYESTPIGKATMSDLDRKAVARYCKVARLKRASLRSLNDKQLLEVQELVVDGHPTRDALLLFGMYPQRYLPGLYITAVASSAREVSEIKQPDNVIEAEHIEGTILQMLDQAVRFIERNTLKTAGSQGEGRSSCYPKRVLTELVLNALIHRDMSFYTDLAPISIAVCLDSVTIMNPGGIYGRERIGDLDKINVYVRNPYLINCLEIMGVAGVRYAGISTVRHELSSAGLPAPMFSSRAGRFTVIIRASADEAGKDAADIRYRILEYCRVPRSKQQIAEHLGLKSVHYVSSTLLTPLVDEGKLALSIPDKPKSKNQRYVTAP